MKLAEKRVLFSKLIAEHLLWLNSFEGVHACFDEVTERITAKDPSSDHMRRSLHHEGLAADINLYDEKWLYLSKTEDHLFSGEVWERRHPLCRWGGRFGGSSSGLGKDGNHYSLEHEGRR